MYANELRNQLPKLADQMTAIVNVAKADGDRGLTSEERIKFHNLESEYTNIEDTIKINARVTSIATDLATAPVSKISEAQIEQLRDEFTSKRKRDNSPHGKAFSNYMRQGERVTGEDRATLSNFRNTMSTTTNSQGGYIVPAGFSDQLEEAKKWFGGVDGVVGKFETGTGNPMPWPTINDTSNKGRIIGQNVQVTETDLVFGQVTFNAYIGSSDLVLIPLALIEDSYFDLDALTAKLLGTRLGRLYNNKCTVGAGTTEPTGIVTAAIAAGSVVTAGGSTSSGEIASITYNDLVNIEHAVDPSYRSTSTWMFSDTMLKTIKKLVDGNARPLWQPGIMSSFREGAGVDTLKPMILDHPYIINSDMAVPAASAYSLLFGDLSTFKVREVAGGTSVLVLRERYADFLQLGMLAFQRFDSNLIDSGTHPIAVFQQSAT